MAERRRFEFFLLRYVPNAVRGESVNIGLVLTESEGGYAGAHFVHDWRRAKCLFPDTDEVMLEALGREIVEQLKTVEGKAVLLARLMDSYSGVVEISPVYQWHGEDPAQELKKLARDLVEVPWLPEAVAEFAPQIKAPNVGRRWLRSQMRSGFETAGLLPLIRQNIAVWPYTYKTDRFAFDFSYGYGANKGQGRVLHAVSLAHKEKDTELFPLRVSKIGPKMEEREKAKLKFTAVVEDDYDREDPQVEYFFNFMEELKVEVASLNRMPELVQRAMVELKA